MIFEVTLLIHEAEIVPFFQSTIIHTQPRNQAHQAWYSFRKGMLCNYIPPPSKCHPTYHVGRDAKSRPAWLSTPWNPVHQQRRRQRGFDIRPQALSLKRSILHPHLHAESTMKRMIWHWQARTDGRRKMVHSHSNLSRRPSPHHNRKDLPRMQVVCWIYASSLFHIVLKDWMHTFFLYFIAVILISIMFCADFTLSTSIVRSR